MIASSVVREFSPRMILDDGRDVTIGEEIGVRAHPDIKERRRLLG